MGGFLAFLAVLGLLALFVAVPVVAIVALVRVSELKKRVEVLEREVRALPARPVAAPLAGNAPPPVPAGPPTLDRPRPSTVAAPPPPSLGTPAPATLSSPAPPRVEHPAPSIVSPPPLPREPFYRRVAWEQWIGVRGAAVLGGIVLALAAILLVKVAFERQWIGGAARCWLGAAAGAGAIVAAEVLRRRRVRVVPNALDGAGVVALFAATWAAHRQWGFFSATVALVLLAGVTAVACFLAIRHRSQLTAVLGLVGGFAAAFLLSEHGDRPLGLFGYLLLLDVALLFVGRRSGWPSLGMLALAGTFLYEALYVFRDLEPERMLFALGVLGAFALVFAAGSALGGGSRKATRGWFASQAGAVLLPFAFAVRFAGASGFQDHVGATFGLVAILSVAACVLARVQRTPWLAVGAAAAGLAVVGTWAVEVGAAGTAAWTLTALGAALALLFHAFAELEERARRLARDDAGAPAVLGPAAALAAAGALLGIALDPWFAARTSAVAWTVGLALPAAALLRQAAWERRAQLALVAGALAGFGVLSHGIHPIANLAQAIPAPGPPSLLTIALALVTGAAGLHGAALLLRGRARDLARHAIAIFVAVGMFGLRRRLGEGSPAGDELALLAPAALLALAAASLGSAAWTAVGALVLATLQHQALVARDSPIPPSALVGAAVGALLFAAAPLVVAARDRQVARPALAQRALWIAAALTTAPGYPIVHGLYVERFSDGASATPLLAFALLVGGLALGAARILAGAPAFRAARAAYAAVAVAFLAAALPVQLDFEWPAVWLALTALGLAVLARRLDASALATLGALAAMGTTIALVTAALTPFHYARSAVPLASWISYAHAVPIAALLGATWILGRSKLALPRGEPAALGLCAVVLGFAWINLSILDAYGEPETSLAFGVEHAQARDLVTSLAWAVYALVLLVAGTALHAGPLRWTSLGLLLVTLAKVFLFDLGELDGLLRVASLAGLALSLIAVSLFYQRFVFRRRPAEAA